MSEIRTFIVASHGQTATAWFAKALDLHPRINCTHAYYYPTLFANDPLFEALSAVERRRVTHERYFRLSFAAYLTELNSAKTAPFLPWRRPFNGSVHCFTAGMMFNHLKTHRPPGLVWMNMIRNPLSRLNSAVAHWENLLNHDIIMRDHLLNVDLQAASHIVEGISAHYDVDFKNPGNALFAVGLLQLEHINLDFQRCLKEGIPNIQSDQLVRDRAYYADIVTRLTRGKLLIKRTYLDDVFSLPRANRHLREDVPKAWCDWQWHGFNIVMKDHVKTAYKEFGYKL